MFDAALRPIADWLADPVARLCVRCGVSANTVSVAGFVMGMAAALAIALGYHFVAVVLILFNRGFDGLDGAVARLTKPTDLGGFLDITLDFIFYSAIPFAIAVGNPEYAVAACFVIFSFMGTGASFLAFAIIAQKRGISTDVRGKKHFFYLGGLTEGTETIIFLLIVTAFPVWFVPLALIFGLLCWITTATRIWTATTVLSDNNVT